MLEIRKKCGEPKVAVTGSYFIHGSLHELHVLLELQCLVQTYVGGGVSVLTTIY